MNYLKQITSFYNSLISVSLSSNAQALYNFLLSVDNSLYWKEKFTSPNSIIMTYLNINSTALLRAREELVENGFIKYKQGNKKDAGIYEIIKLYSEDDLYTICNESEDNLCTYNKQNKTIKNEIKENEINEIKQTKVREVQEVRKSYGEYKNVLLSNDEYEKLKEENENYNELIDYLDCYIEEKGYKTNNCYLAIKRWVKKAVNDSKQKSKESKETKTATKKGPLNNFKSPDIDFNELKNSLMNKQKLFLKADEEGQINQEFPSLSEFVPSGEDTC